MPFTEIDTSKSFNISSASVQLSATATDVNEEMNEKSNALAASPDDPSALANFNAAVSKWSVTMNVVSSITKFVKDTSMSIVQKM